MATSFLALISPIKRTILRNREYQADATGARRKGGNVERTYSIEGNHRFHRRGGKKKKKEKKVKIKLEIGWHCIYSNLVTVHKFQRILHEKERKRGRENSVDRIEAARCIDNENTGNDLTVREKRPTVGHKPSIPRAKFIRRPL